MFLAAPARGAFPGANGKIAFTSERDGNAEIYMMRADGTGQRNLSRSAVPNDFPAWSGFRKAST